MKFSFELTDAAIDATMICAGIVLVVAIIIGSIAGGVAYSGHNSQQTASQALEAGYHQELVGQRALWVQDD